MNENYTPTRAEVKAHYKSRIDAALDDEEFDRWLAEERRKAKAEAWVEGRDHGLDDLGATQTAIDFGELTNPYEEE